MDEISAYKAAKDGVEVRTTVDVIRHVPKTSFRREVLKGERGKVTAVDDTGAPVQFPGHTVSMKVPRTKVKKWADDSTPNKKETT